MQNLNSKNCELIGLVLTGGQSSRMGRDKGLIEHAGKAWSQHSAHLLKGCGLKTFISINATQQATYARIFERDCLLMDADLAIGGPLLGILTAHKHFPAASILVLACDMQNMQVAYLKELIEKFFMATAPSSQIVANQEQEDNTEEFFAFHNSASGGVEPLCAIFHKNGLKRLYKEMQLNKLSATCPRKLIHNGPTWQRKLKKDEVQFFANWNRVADIQHKQGGKHTDSMAQAN